jgi:hypothetical protein
MMTKLRPVIQSSVEYVKVNGKYLEVKFKSHPCYCGCGMIINPEPIWYDMGSEEQALEHFKRLKNDKAKYIWRELRK